MPAGPKGRIKKPAQVLLESFTESNLTSWNRQVQVSSEYEVRRYFYLTGQRALRQTEISSAIRGSSGIPYTLDGWARVVDFKYSLESLSSAGSTKGIGGRFNYGEGIDPINFTPFPALYLAEDNETAMQERFGSGSSDSFTAAELALRSSTSFSCVKVRGEFADIFDLTDSESVKEFVKIISKIPVTREMYRLSKTAKSNVPIIITSVEILMQSLMAEDWRAEVMLFDLPANSQIFGKIVKDCGYEGILYQSVKGKGKCLAVFPESLQYSSSYIEIAGPAPSGSVTRLDSSTWADLV